MSVAPSSALWRPYETHPSNPIITSVHDDQLILQRAYVHQSSAKIRLSFLPHHEGQRAGLAAYYRESRYYAVQLTRDVKGSLLLRLDGCLGRDHYEVFAEVVLKEFELDSGIE